MCGWPEAHTAWNGTSNLGPYAGKVLGQTVEKAGVIGPYNFYGATVPGIVTAWSKTLLAYDPYGPGDGELWGLLHCQLFLLYLACLWWEGRSYVLGLT